MIEVALLLQDPAEGLTSVRVSMKELPRNSEYISYDGKKYVVTGHTHLVGKIPILVDTPDGADRASMAAPVEVEVTAWRR